MTRKDLIISVLIILCLTVAVFPYITKSQTAEMGGYDPWIDYNDDGKIDHKDLLQLAATYGTSGDPTKNVTVTNWPEDRPPTIKKGIEKIVILDTFFAGDGHGSTEGVTLSKPIWDTSMSRFLYNFEPKGELINITDVYINYIWRAGMGGSLENPHLVDLVFWEKVPLGGDSDHVALDQGVGMPWGTRPRAYCLVISNNKPDFNFSLIQPGINSVEISRRDEYGDYIYIFNLVLFIEYCYLDETSNH